MATKADWQDATGKVWARSFDRTDRAFAGLTQIMLERLSAMPGEAILDIGCGAGELSIALATARPHARIRGIDVSPELVETSRQRGATCTNLAFDCADATTWADASFSPELLTSRHGVMFFDDPVAAFGNFHAIVQAGGRVFFSCFRAPALNAWVTEPSRLLGLPAPDDPFAPGPFAFADEDRTRSILAKAGWREIDFEPVDFGFVVGAGDDPVTDALAFFRKIGPPARALFEMADAAREDALGKIARWLAGKPHDGGVLALPAAAWIVTARKAD